MSKDAAPTVPVPLVRLDDMVKEHVLILKVDSEGFEPFIIGGATRLLAEKAVDHIIIEVKTADFRRDLQALLLGHGYECRVFSEQYHTVGKTPSYSADSVDATLATWVKPCVAKNAFEDFWFSRVGFGLPSETPQTFPINGVKAA